MILVTRLNGSPFAVNPDLLERVEATPDTVLTLIDGTKYLVLEPVADVIELVRTYRASIVASARQLGEDGDRERAAHSARLRHDHPHLQLARPGGCDEQPLDTTALDTTDLDTTGHDAVLAVVTPAQPLEV